MTLVSSANIMNYDKVFIAGGRSFMYITKRKGMELTLGELNILLFTSMRKDSEWY
jgi:hypothetical protein